MPSASPGAASVTVHLDPDSVNAVAERVVQLLRSGPVGVTMIDATEVARRLGVSPSYVYNHADDLGAVRLGDGPKPRLRFDPDKVTEAFAGSSPSGSQHVRAAVRPVRRGREVPLLPVLGESP